MTAQMAARLLARVRSALSGIPEDAEAVAARYGIPLDCSYVRVNAAVPGVIGGDGRPGFDDYPCRIPGVNETFDGRLILNSPDSFAVEAQRYTAVPNAPTYVRTPEQIAQGMLAITPATAQPGGTTQYTDAGGTALDINPATGRPYTLLEQILRTTGQNGYAPAPAAQPASSPASTAQAAQATPPPPGTFNYGTGAPPATNYNLPSPGSSPASPARNVVSGSASPLPSFSFPQLPASVQPAVQRAADWARTVPTWAWAGAAAGAAALYFARKRGRR